MTIGRIYLYLFSFLLFDVQKKEPGKYVRKGAYEPSQKMSKFKIDYYGCVKNLTTDFYGWVKILTMRQGLFISKFLSSNDLSW